MPLSDNVVKHGILSESITYRPIDLDPHDHKAPHNNHCSAVLTMFTHIYISYTQKTISLVCSNVRVARLVNVFADH